MGKSTISMAIFNSYVSHYQRVCSTQDMQLGRWETWTVQPSLAEASPQSNVLANEHHPFRVNCPTQKTSKKNWPHCQPCLMTPEIILYSGLSQKKTHIRDVSIMTYKTTYKYDMAMTQYFIPNPRGIGWSHPLRTSRFEVMICIQWVYSPFFTIIIHYCSPLLFTTIIHHDIYIYMYTDTIIYTPLYIHHYIYTIMYIYIYKSTILYCLGSPRLSTIPERSAFSNARTRRKNAEANWAFKAHRTRTEPRNTPGEC